MEGVVIMGNESRINDDVLFKEINKILENHLKIEEKIEQYYNNKEKN